MSLVWTWVIDKPTVRHCLCDLMLYLSLPPPIFTILQSWGWKFRGISDRMAVLWFLPSLCVFMGMPVRAGFSITCKCRRTGAVSNCVLCVHSSRNNAGVEATCPDSHHTKHDGWSFVALGRRFPSRAHSTRLLLLPYRSSVKHFGSLSVFIPLLEELGVGGR